VCARRISAFAKRKQGCTPIGTVSITLLAFVTILVLTVLFSFLAFLVFTMFGQLRLHLLELCKTKPCAKKLFESIGFSQRCSVRDERKWRHSAYE